MKIIIRSAAAALVLSLVGVTGAQAQTDVTGDFGNIDGSTPTGIACIDAFNATLFAFNQCSGAWNGNNLGNSTPPATDVEAYINNVWGIDESAMDYTGASLFGEFVLAVKGTNSFSLFYFADHDGSELDLTVAMLGVAPGQAVSHASVYRGETFDVPEPATVFLLGTGLLAMSLLGWRRREEILA